MNKIAYIRIFHTEEDEHIKDDIQITARTFREFI
jgi:hypothetical protein